MMYLLEMLVFVAMLIAVVVAKYRRNFSAWQSIFFSIWICFVIYLNAPNFLVVIDGTAVKPSILTFPFYLYNKWGTGYILISNILLGAAGIILDSNRNNEITYNTKAVKGIFDDFIHNATALKIIGRDLDFLLSSEYSAQREKIKSLKKNAKLLCERTKDKKLIDLYHQLVSDGNQVRCYTNRDGIANLKGQIKVDEKSISSGIFITKHGPQKEKYTLTEMGSGYLLNSVSNQFDRTFSEATHPYIRCIALDLGGVYLKGDIDDFYSFLNREYNIKIKKQKADRLNISNDLMLGKITIRDFIAQKDPAKAQKLTDAQWEAILVQWNTTWKPDPAMYRLVEQLHELGYTIIPFSNLDKENGDKYLREHYLPSCCEHHFFSYERKKTKPNSSAFKNFEEFAKEIGCIHQPYQILLIDDQSENITEAEKHSWLAVPYYNNSPQSNVLELIGKLKKIAILPQGFE